MTIRTQEQNDAAGHSFQGLAVASKDDDTDDEGVVSPGYSSRATLVLSPSSVSSGGKPTSTDGTDYPR